MLSVAFNRRQEVIFGFVPNPKITIVLPKLAAKTLLHCKAPK